VVIGRGLADGVGELRNRTTGERRDLPLSALGQTVADELRNVPPPVDRA
jgi:hypothetical protein